MAAVNGFPFFKNVEEAKISDVYKSHANTDASIEVKGSASAFNLEVQACIDIEQPENWITLAVIDESSYDILNAVSKPGIYSFSVMGKNVRVKINSISGGDLTVVGKFLY